MTVYWLYIDRKPLPALSQETEAQLFGSTFERKGQEQRIKALLAIGGVEKLTLRGSTI